MKNVTIILAVLLVAAASLQAAPLVWMQDVAFPGTGLNTNGVSMAGGDVYVAGDDQTANYVGRVWKKSGNVWTDMGVGGGFWLDDAEATSASNVWASGNGRVDYYDGTSWTQTAIGGEATAIGTSGPGMAVTGGFGGVPRMLTTDGGATWTNLPASGIASQEDRSFIMNSPTDIWIGTGDAGTYTPYVQHWDGTSYTTYAVPLPLGVGTKVYEIAQGGGELYAVGLNQAASRLVGGVFVELAHPWGNYQASRAAAVDPATGDLYVGSDRGAIHQYDVSAGVWVEQLYLGLGGEQFNSIAIEGGIIYAVGTPQVGIWAAEIPEPATMSLLGLGVIALIRKRQR